MAGPIGDMAAAVLVFVAVVITITFTTMLFQNVNNIKMMRAHLGLNQLVVSPLQADDGWRSNKLVELMNQLDDKMTMMVLALMVCIMVDVAANPEKHQDDLLCC